MSREPCEVFGCEANGCFFGEIPRRCWVFHNLIWETTIYKNGGFSEKSLHVWFQECYEQICEHIGSIDVRCFSETTGGKPASIPLEFTSTRPARIPMRIPYIVFTCNLYIYNHIYTYVCSAYMHMFMFMSYVYVMYIYVYVFFLCICNKICMCVFIFVFMCIFCKEYLIHEGVIFLHFSMYSKFAMPKIGRHWPCRPPRVGLSNK